MSRRCSLTGKEVQFGHNVSHANRRTNRRFQVNLQKVSLVSEALGPVLFHGQGAGMLPTAAAVLDVLEVDDGQSVGPGREFFEFEAGSDASIAQECPEAARGNERARFGLHGMPVGAQRRNLRKRSRTPQAVTRISASTMMRLDIFDSPRIRSVNEIGTSTTVPPVRNTR